MQVSKHTSARPPDHHILHLCLVELASNALGDDLPVGPAAAALDGSLGELVAGVELAGGPAGPAEVDVGVLVEGVELLAQHGQAAGVVGAAGLGEDGLALVGAEPLAEGVEGVDVVGGAGGVGAGAVGVEVLVDVEDQVVGAAVEVGDLVKSGGGAVVDEGAGVGPLVAGEEELVAGGAGLADGGDGSLDGSGPGVDGDIVLEMWSVPVRRWLCLGQELGTRTEILTGSFMMPKAILSLPLYLVAICDQRLANSASVGPPWPTIWPFQRA